MTNRNEALLCGAMVYVGRACKLGHTVRRSSDYACVACERARNRTYHHQDPKRTRLRARRRYAAKTEYYRAYLRSWYAKHRRKIGMRQAQARYDIRNLLHDQRGVATFVFLVVAIPLIAAVSLGAEASSWMVIRQYMQNAADAASMAGAATLAIQNVPGTTLSDPQTVEYRSKQFAAKSGFCVAGDSDPDCAAPPPGATRTVVIDQPASDQVRATLTQRQPTYLAQVVGIAPFDIIASATAQVKQPLPICALALGSNTALALGGTITNPDPDGCVAQSNSALSSSGGANFSGSKWVVAATSGCSGSCDLPVPHHYYSLPATNPLKVLDTESFNTRTGNTKTSSSMTPNSSTGAYGNLTVPNGNTVTFAAGTYFFYNATIKINGGTVSGTGVTLVLLGDSSLLISSNAHVDLSAPTTNAFSSALNGVLIDDQAPNKSNNAVTVNGGGTVKLGGAMYFPHVDVTWSGTAANANTTCSEVIADTLTITGNAYLSTQNCAPSTVAHTQAVTLVQ